MSAKVYSRFAGARGPVTVSRSSISANEGPHVRIYQDDGRVVKPSVHLGVRDAKRVIRALQKFVDEGGG